MAWGKVEITLGILGAVIAVATLGYAIYTDPPEIPIVSQNSRFFCALQADPSKGGDVWTVLYRYGKTNQPWLRMVRAMGEEWDTQKRCEEIAERLDTFRQDGLLSFDYRTDPSTPGQYVLCARTRISGDSCPLVLTLMPEDNPYLELREVAGALLPGNLPSYQCDNPQNCPPAQPVAINLKDQLVEEDQHN